MKTQPKPGTIVRHRRHGLAFVVGRGVLPTAVIVRYFKQEVGLARVARLVDLSRGHAY